MPLTLIRIPALFASLMIVVSPYLTVADQPNSYQPLANGNTSFAVDLYGKLKQPQNNLFFSPYSISSVMAMVYGGAAQNTEKEIKNTLHFSPTQEQLHSAFRDLNEKLISSSHKHDQTLRIANGLCLTGGDLSENFKAQLRNYYNAEIFHGDLDRINSWVEEKTEGKIERILENLDRNSVAVILNAIYFKGIWENRFDESMTRDSKFHISADQYVTTPFMYQKGYYRTVENDTFQAISIPYRGEEMSMVVLLPKKTEGLNGLEERFSAEKLTDLLAALDSQPAEETELYLPTFSMETEYDLKATLKLLGINDAFKSGVADFTPMGWPKGELWISQVKHKAALEVNEEGTEAAAATAVEMRTVSLRTYPQFRADHPFMFLIRDNRTHSVLFMGRLVNPN